MTWHDYGLIFKVDQLYEWAISHAYVPTAIELDDRIRIFVSFWDKHKYGRLGYIDVDSANPTIVLGHSLSPILEDSKPPAFDSSGVTPLSILKENDSLFLYYAGWYLHNDPKIRYQLFTGLLIGDLNGENIRRFSPEPIITRRNPNEHVRTGGQILKTKHGYRCYLATQVGKHNDGKKSLPIYRLEATYSKDGIKWEESQQVIFDYQDKNILGYGRSAIWQNKLNNYEGLFSVRNWNGAYSDLMYSTSEDGLIWQDLSQNGKAFLSSMTCDKQSQVCFPSLIFQKERMLMFYNGNNFGREGLRLAIWNYN